MANIGPETQNVINKLNAATTKIGDRIAALVAAADLTAEEKAAFQVEIDRLTVMGTDPSNPVPPVP